MLNHTNALTGLRTRLLTLSGTWDFAKENEQFTPTVGRAYIEEEYTPGQSSQTGVGPGGTVETFPIYHLRVHTPEGAGATAAQTFRDALLALFYPRLAITLSDSVALRVLTSPGPSFAPSKRYKPGWSTSPMTIPLWAVTSNPN